MAVSRQWATELRDVLKQIQSTDGRVLSEEERDASARSSFERIVDGIEVVHRAKAEGLNEYSAWCAYRDRNKGERA